MWAEEDSEEFIEYGKYFVPEREVQLDVICRLIPAGQAPFHVLELCCGEGLLAENILERFPNCTVHGYDGSPEMLRQATSRLARFGQHRLDEVGKRLLGGHRCRDRQFHRLPAASW